MSLSFTFHGTLAATKAFGKNNKGEVFNHVSSSDLVCYIKLVFKLIYCGLSDFMLLNHYLSINKPK